MSDNQHSNQPPNSLSVPGQASPKKRGRSPSPLPGRASPSPMKSKKRSFDEITHDAASGTEKESEPKRVRLSDDEQDDQAVKAAAEPAGDNHAANQTASSVATPVTESTSTANGAESQAPKKKLRLTSGSHSHIGRRATMEDTHVALEDARNLISTYCPDAIQPRTAYFAVYDGHAGRKAADYLQAHLHIRLFQQPEFWAHNYPTALTNAFKKVDTELVGEGKSASTGSTAAAALIVDKTIYFANVGDTEAILISTADNGEAKGQATTTIHRPTEPNELKRILDLGGSVFVGRVFGMLAVSRAFGDKDFKNGADYVSADPAVASFLLTEQHQNIVIACDGLWDVLKYDQVARTVVKMREAKQTPDAVAATLVKKALEHGSEDNVTVVVIFLEWVDDLGLPDTPPMPATPPLHDQTPPLHLLGRGDTETKGVEDEDSDMTDGGNSAASAATAEGVDTEELSTPETSPAKRIGGDTPDLKHG